MSFKILAIEIRRDYISNSMVRTFWYQNFMDPVLKEPVLQQDMVVVAVRLANTGITTHSVNMKIDIWKWMSTSLYKM